MFRSDSLSKLIGEVKTVKITNHIAPISIDKIRVVDEELSFGENFRFTTNFGKSSRLGNFCIKKVNNNLYWVAPLLHSGFKWFNNQEGTAGYVMVSATNERDKISQYRRDIKIKYQQGAYFQSIHRRFIFGIR
jgi:hypothetical protein